ncbi:MAG: hypothetical protein J0G32_00680 [Alphaproteobacteria bacterium]|nr:hypothetical protein [Alphaproteobacteria bacterium]OJV14088.1 MAG: hypothetical protein BGO27_01205 [Alphaproteobacteria bacterium 33-17]
MGNYHVRVMYPDDTSSKNGSELITITDSANHVLNIHQTSEHTASKNNFVGNIDPDYRGHYFDVAKMISNGQTNNPFSFYDNDKQGYFVVGYDKDFDTVHIDNIKSLILGPSGGYDADLHAYVYEDDYSF